MVGRINVSLEPSCDDQHNEARSNMAAFRLHVVFGRNISDTDKLKKSSYLKLS